MNKKILLYLGLMALGLYVMPNTVALFAGQHAFYSGMGVSCAKCHSDILSQIEASGYVYEKHRAAAGNINYTTYLSIGGTNYSNGVMNSYNGKTWTWNGNAWVNGTITRRVSLDKNNNGIINGDEICLLCHNATLAGSIVHTMVVRVCDDDRCHGNRNNYFNSPQLFNKATSNITAAGYNLSRQNGHQPFYLGAGNMSSNYEAPGGFGAPGNANGSSGFISRGYWTCAGCHTGTVVNATIVQASVYDHSVSDPVKRRY